MSLERLPAELRLEIIRYLSTPDLKALRQVNTELRDNAAPALFRRAVVAPRYHALATFQNISLAPSLSTHVKEVVFDGSVYDSFIAEREAFYLHHNAVLPGLQKGSTLEKHDRWIRYGQLFNEQDHLQSGETMLDTITCSLTRMPKLSSIVYSPHPCLIPIEAEQMKDLLPRGVSCVPVRTGQAGGYTLPDHPFHYLVYGIFLSRYTGVETLRVEAPFGGVPSTEYSLCMFDLCELGLQANQFLFQHLKNLELNMSLVAANIASPIVVGPRGLSMMNTLAILLSAAEKLEHLALHLTHWDYTSIRMYGHIVYGGPLFPFLGLGKTWSELKTLSLEGIYGDEQNFVNLIARHKKTLVSVIFKKCTIVKGVWSKVVDKVVGSLMVHSFALDRVNETTLPTGHYWPSLSAEVRESWRYEGQLEVLDDGERVFAETHNKRSVYGTRCIV